MSHKRQVISFAFSHGIGWYVTAVAETVLNLLVSSFSKRLNFDGTHLVQRMSLLTLIILGEAILGLHQNHTTIYFPSYIIQDKYLHLTLVQLAWKETFALASFVGGGISAILIIVSRPILQ